MGPDREEFPASSDAEVTDGNQYRGWAGMYGRVGVLLEAVKRKIMTGRPPIPPANRG